MKNYTSSILSISRVEIVQIALIYYILENHNMCIMEEILIAIKVMDNLINIIMSMSICNNFFNPFFLPVVRDVL